MQNNTLILPSAQSAPTLRTIEQITADIRAHAKLAALSILSIGQDLTDAKAQLRHGEWLPWLKEVGIAPKTAENYMRLAREVIPGSTLSALPYKERLAGRDPDEWLFQSEQPDRITKRPKPIDRRTAYRDMQAIARIGGFPEDYKIGTHTLRKTFGYRYYQSTHDIASLMKLFNHAKEETTLIYIGIASDEMKQTFRKIDRMYDT